MKINLKYLSKDAKDAKDAKDVKDASNEGLEFEEWKSKFLFYAHELLVENAKNILVTAVDYYHNIIDE